MEITKEKLAKLFSYNDEVTKLKDDGGLALQNARLNDKNEIEVERDGQKVMIAEKELWTEVFELGAKCQAGEILRAKYPEVFNTSKQTEDKGAEMRDFIIAEFGFDFKAMTVTDYVKLTLALIEYKKNGN